MTSAIERTAQQVIDLMPPLDLSLRTTGSVILTVSIIMLVIKAIMLAWEFWKDKHRAATIARNPNWIQRIYLRRLVRKVLKEHGQEDKTSQVVAALLQIASASTPEDIEAVFKEAQENPEIWLPANDLM